jgi:hypothetical protein
MAGSAAQYPASPVAVRATQRHLTLVMKSLILAFIALAAAYPAFAAQDGYPPGLFEHSPVLPGPNDPPESQGPPSDAGGPLDAAGPPDGNESLDDFCASIASRTFHSLAEVKRAHAKCDQGNPAPDQ